MQQVKCYLDYWFTHYDCISDNFTSEYGRSWIIESVGKSAGLAGCGDCCSYDIASDTLNGGFFDTGAALVVETVRFRKYVCQSEKN